MAQARTLLSFCILFCMMLLIWDTNRLPVAVSTQGKHQEKDHLIVGTIGSPSIFNPYFSADSSSGQIEALLYNGLITYDPKLQPIPDLAESWKVSKDGYSWTFHLKKGVRFHDGVEVTAQDVVFSYQIPRQKGYSGPRGSDFEKIKSIEAMDRYTVNFTLKEPYAPFLSTCTYAILPAHLLRDVPMEKLAEHPFNTKQPVGTGPFRFAKWEDGQYIELTAHADYFKGKPKIQHLYFRIVPDQNAQLIHLQSGGMDWMSIPATDLAIGKLFEKQGKIRLHSSPSLSYTYIGYNLKLPLFQDLRVRQALTYALDRQSMVDIVLEGQGQVAHTHGSSLSWAYSDDIPELEFNPLKAKELLAEAGWKDTDGDGILDRNGKKFSFILLTNQGNKMREMVSQIVQDQWAAIGIEVKPRLMEWSAFIHDHVETKNFEAVLLGWSLGVDPDPTAIWHSKEMEKGLNFGSYNNPEVDRLLEENTREMDQDKRKQLLVQFQKKVAEDQPFTFLYYANGITAYPTNLQGAMEHPVSTFYNIHNWSFQ